MISKELTDRLRADVARLRAARAEVERTKKDAATPKETVAAWNKYVEECVGFASVVAFLDEAAEITVSIKETT